MCSLRERNDFKKEVILIMKRSGLLSGILVVLAMILMLVGGVSAATITAPKVSTPPVIDGKLDEAVWSAAHLSGSYITTWELNTGGAPGVKTEAWVVWDDTNLYVAFRNWQDMKYTKALVTVDEGPIAADDDNEVFLAPKWPAPLPYYQLMTNPNGARSDGKEKDKSWGCNWKVAVGKYDDYWISEIAIPLAELGKAPKEGDEWGFNITRRWDKGGQWITFTPGLVSFHTPEKFSTLKLGKAAETLAINPGFEELGAGVPGWGR